MKRLAGTTIAALVTAVGACLVAVGCGATRHGYDEPAFDAAMEDGRFEVREYGSMTVAAAPMRSQADGDRDGAFGRLFRYISGDNEGERKIPMTTPVYMDDDTMQFVVPDDVARDGAPAPDDPAVQVRTVSERRMAVVRWAGRPTPDVVADKTAALRSWMEARGLRAAGEPVVAQYDPPWTPGFMRRTEVLIEVE